ncbi:MAG: RluA family pseudouridine synthase [Thermosediminibacteraceae bacterium]|nr:RluA family pseudouridine synthase [Thermosediminibacteraceae bacterium]
MEKVFEIKVAEEDVKKRLDVFLSSVLNDFSRSYIQKGIEEGWVKVNGKLVKPNYKLKKDDVIVAEIPAPKPLTVEPENIPLDIIYEDKDIIVVNKPRGMVVYPAPGNYSGTLVNALLYHTKDLSGINGVLRPGIVHRLDKDTSGAIVVAKNDIAHRELAKQFKNKKVKKTYLAVVWGNIPEDKATIEAPIGRHPVKRVEMAVNPNNGKEAITHFKVLERFGDFTFVEVNIETGRTHQIRVHMSFIGHPIVGDPIYSKRKNPFNITGQALHAFRLGLFHPRSGEFMTFEAPIPEDLGEILNILRKRG